MRHKSVVDDCSLINLPKIVSERKGNLTHIYNNEHIPFDIARVYYLYDIPAGAARGAHAHKELQQLIVSASGSFDVIVNDGSESKTIHLNRPYEGLIIPTYIWRELNNFSGGSVCLVLASMPYIDNDYIRDYSQFLKLKDLS